MAQRRTGDELAPPGDPEVRERILEAAEYLCGTRAISEVTIREIAARASLSPGLLHYYFPSKNELLGATLTRMSKNYMACVGDLSSTDEIAGRIFDIVSDRPGLPRLAAWMLLERVNPLEVGSDPMAEYWLSLAEAGAESAPTRARAWTALMIIASWGVYRDYILSIEASTSADERDVLVAEIREVVVQLGRPAASQDHSP